MLSLWLLSPRFTPLFADGWNVHSLCNMFGQPRPTLFREKMVWGLWPSSPIFFLLCRVLINNHFLGIQNPAFLLSIYCHVFLSSATCGGFVNINKDQTSTLVKKKRAVKLMRTRIMRRSQYLFFRFLFNNIY
jgi:hypothetical protein